MSIDHRLVYKSDIGLFLPLAIPGVNAVIVDFLVGFSTLSNAVELGKTVTPLVGLMATLGLGLAYLRLRLADSRITLITSTLVKFAAAYWLTVLAISGLSPAFYLFAGMDLMLGLYLLYFVIFG